MFFREGGRKFEGWDQIHTKKNGLLIRVAYGRFEKQTP